jgi:formylglycine-generating enzyme required for sulfatase activity
MVAHLYNRECGWIWDDTPPGWFVDQQTLTLIVEWDADCNNDGAVDYGQIINGALADANTNGVPDICECDTHPELGACRCAGDIVTDGTVNGADLGTLLAYWGPANSGAFSRASDINSDGRIDGSDLGVLLSNWGTCQFPGATVPPWATLIDALPDPSVVTNPTLRTAIAATGLAWRVRDTATGIEMLLVPPGTFQMGCSASSTNDTCPSLELPMHAVTLSRAFYLGRTEVTQGTWAAQTGSNPSVFRDFADSQERPVESVSWIEAKNFVSLRGMRLPTEAEWEFACRAGVAAPFHNGSNRDVDADTIAWHSANSGNATHPVGRKSANALGFFDMAGNVWEWNEDWWDGSGHPYSDSAQIDPAGPTTGSYRSCRGGCWSMSTRYVRSSARGNASPNATSSIVGFRVARNP